MITLCTSLSPQRERQTVQMEALISWVRHGFAVCSLNAPAEIAVLADFGSVCELVPFMPGPRDAQGRALVPVAKLLELSFDRNQGNQAWLLNSDLILDGGPEVIGPVGESDVVLIPRWDLDTGNRSAVSNPWGWDGVVLGKNLRGLFTNPRFMLGTPWWDYWVPFRALSRGFAVHCLVRRWAVHPVHPERWNERDRRRLAGQMWAEAGVGPLRRLWLRHFGPKKERKLYGYHNHLAGHIRDLVASRALPR